MADEEQEMRDFGMLGKNDVIHENTLDPFAPRPGLTDKILDSVVESMMRSVDKQMRSQIKDMDKAMENAEIKTTPNGIRIKITSPFGGMPNQPQQQEVPFQQLQKRGLTENQIKKMSTLPREKAKTSVRRIGDKIVYELTTPEVTSPEDVFVSKLESGYEIKAIGNKQIFVNSIPINLPIKRYTVAKNKLLLEFTTQEQ
jgi:hypothetical protein